MEHTTTEEKRQTLLKQIEEESIGDRDALYREISAQEAEQHISGDIYASTPLNVREIAHFPLPHYEDEWNRVRREFETRCPNMAKVIYSNMQHVSTEYKLNHRIHLKKPKWTLVMENKRESLWRREWTEKDNDIMVDFVVFPDSTKPPTPKHFKHHKQVAFRFVNEHEAKTFMNLRMKTNERVSKVNEREDAEAEQQSVIQ